MDQRIVSPLMGVHNGLTLVGAAQFLVRTLEESVKDSVGSTHWNLSSCHRTILSESI